MSKYIIEIKPEYEDSFKGLMILGAKDSNLFVDTLAVENLEQYIPADVEKIYDKAYGDGYNKGFEDGKKSTEKGCEGCKYVGVEEDAPPCRSCSKSFLDRYEPAPHSDRIEVGDEVTTHWAKGIATVADYGNDIFYVMFSDGSCGKREVNTLKKTGKHYDIQSILEAMRT